MTRREMRRAVGSVSTASWPMARTGTAAARPTPQGRKGLGDVYQVSIHGQDKGVSPVLAQALGARVALMGNGPRKGGAPQTWETLRGARGLEDIWQVHYSIAGGKDHNPPDDFLANPDGPDEAHWLKLSAQNNGVFTVTNSRNGFKKEYK
jgi:competence protein ComEC